MTPSRHSSMTPGEVGAAVRQLRVHDVTPPVDDELVMFFANVPPCRHPIGQHATDGVASNVWEMHEHTGAHVDAPFHFDPHGPTIDALAPDALFFRPFKKLDLVPDDPQPGEPIELEQLRAAVERGGFSLDVGDVAIIDFGWDRYLPGGIDAREPSWWGSNEPGLSDRACDYLATAGISAVACDTAGCDVSIRDGEMIGAPGHTEFFLPKGILIVEGLRGLADVPSTGLFVALPLPLAKGTASPVRVLLLTE